MHLINKHKLKGTYSFAYTGEKPWHFLGHGVSKAMTAAEAMVLSNMDYIVDKAPLYAAIGEFNEKEQAGGLVYHEYEGRFATYREDTKELLGMVSKRYEVVQNVDAFSFFDAIIDKGEAIFETAGVLGKGERIFILAKLPGDFLIKGEVCEKYLLLVNSHDGTSAVIVGMTTVRVVCNNTLQAALKGLQNKITVSHTKNAKDQIKEGYRVMGIASTYMKEVEQAFSKMADTKLDDKNLRKYIADTMMADIIVDETTERSEQMSKILENQVNTIYEFALSHPTQTTNATRGNVFGGYNAISAYFNNIEYKTPEQKFTSQFFGNANKKILKGFSKALELV